MKGKLIWVCRGGGAYCGSHTRWGDLYDTFDEALYEIEKRIKEAQRGEKKPLMWEYVPYPMILIGGFEVEVHMYLEKHEELDAAAESLSLSSSQTEDLRKHLKGIIYPEHRV